ncbi:MAG TPA: hypothetical protein VG317_19120 [Pseudonocardiaceae bacterium]|jgi:hypothetical protein|nr:hypothetical protein [Pseudonocardiaceae bacterium]
MDPRDRADAALARARARGPFVVTPEDAVSPMDAASTQQIPRVVVNALDAEQPTEATRIIRPVSPPPARPQAPQQVQQQAPQQVQPQPPAQAPPPVQPPAQAQPTQPLPRPAAQPAQAKQPAQAAQVSQPEQPTPPEQSQPTRQVDGLVPTVQQPATQRSLLSRRLDGE